MSIKYILFINSMNIVLFEMIVLFSWIWQGIQLSRGIGRKTVKRLIGMQVHALSLDINGLFS